MVKNRNTEKTNKRIRRYRRKGRRRKKRTMTRRKDRVEQDRNKEYHCIPIVDKSCLNVIIRQHIFKTFITVTKHGFLLYAIHLFIYVARLSVVVFSVPCSLCVQSSGRV